MRDLLKELISLRARAPKPYARGLSDPQIAHFLNFDCNLAAAISAALDRFNAFEEEFPNLRTRREEDLLSELQEGFLNFYSADSVSPYVPIAARGPWIVTVAGRVIYETGGYGMLGFGHAPDEVRQILNEPLVMANIMTASFSQARFMKRLRQKIGFTRDSCPYKKFSCVNSGSEAMSVATRISDVHAKQMTDPGAPYEGRRIMFLSLEGGFHGRTCRPAQASSSSQKYYQALATFRDSKRLITVKPNDIQGLNEIFSSLSKEKIFIEAMLFEPVMGEGNPGLAMTPEFYAEARKLTEKHGALLISDSIQAGLRAKGVLSIVDYPGFSKLPAPDMETFSKALNAGQFPLSVLALNEKAAALYRPGIYGNTMTTNPRALEVACAVLDALTPASTAYIGEAGKEFLEKLEKARLELKGDIVKTQGTGLLLSAELAPDLEVVGVDGIEQTMRKLGVQVIHGGKNSLRFTPHFAIKSEEIDLIVSIMKEAIQQVRGAKKLSRAGTSEAQASPMLK